MNTAPMMTDKSSIYSSRNPEKINFLLLTLLSASLFLGSSCGLVHNLFGPKSGCPSNGKNVGAERILSGEKVPKASKFKA